jgi:hypothetical protein
MHDPPNRGDFQPRLGKAAAEALGQPELVRLGVSHYETLAQARSQRRREESRIAQVILASPRIHFARTGRLAGHLDVWAPVEELVKSAEVVE